MVLNHATARALADAGLMHPAEYVRLCRVHGWGMPRHRPRLIVITAARVCAFMAILIFALPAHSAPRRHRPVCVPTRIEGVGVVQICAPAPRRR